MSKVPIKFTISEKNYVNPFSFDPDNFDPENFKNKFSFQGFGQGPRACPGSRYAMLALKIFLARLLPQYRVVPGEKTNKGDLKVKENIKVYSILILHLVDICHGNV